MTMTEEIYVCLTISELSTCKHIVHEYFCESIFRLQRKYHKAVNQLYALIYHLILSMTVVTLISFTI